MIDLKRRADLLDAPARSAPPAGRPASSFQLVMGDVKRCRAETPFAACGFHRAWRTRSLASRFDSGSSNRKAAGLRTMARPMATRWRWPPESARGLRSR